ncbi:MAG: DNA (cytosine-5-)-methyltransferase [Bacteroidia bacterium]|nr:MAG: DNA (cytosine-5-)-methyltransferase [Bacteroidia bacterium]
MGCSEGRARPRFIDLFAGIGGIRLPFDELGYQCVFSSEWDSSAQQTYEANFGERPHGDITQIPEDEIPAHDLLLAGFPCQPFSIIGKMDGFSDTRGTLFFDIARILAHHQPQVLLLENVKQLTSHDKGQTFRVIRETLADLGYHLKYKVLNALDFGLPQKRERIIIVGFRDPAYCQRLSLDFAPQPYDLATILEDEASIPPGHFASEAIRAKRATSTEGRELFYPSVWHENKAGNISVHDHSCALRSGASYNYLLVNGVRRFTSRELLRLQGFPEWFRIVVSHAQIRRQTGNSVPVSIIRAVAERIDATVDWDLEPMHHGREA